MLKFATILFWTGKAPFNIRGINVSGWFLKLGYWNTK